ncbi:MAG: hypothetical protein A2Y33_12525 [Spirochaetes bacterium GWF1_51_8]|nr:MAG: hypothetical protein A2Y33_12525 [Spirochaetes bacterium GWF1_51_8]
MIPEWLDLMKQAVFILFCAFCLLTDLRSGRIYNYITLPVLVFGWLVSGFAGTLPDSLLGTLLAAALFVPGVYMDKIGAGDLKFAAVSGALLGWKGLLAALAIAGVMALYAGIGSRKESYPLALFLAPASAAAQVLTGYLVLI